MIEVDERLTDLTHIPKNLRADNGEPGRRRFITGKKGKDRIIKVPRGVVIWRWLLPSDALLMRGVDRETTVKSLSEVRRKGIGGVSEVDTVRDDGLLGVRNGRDGEFSRKQVREMMRISIEDLKRRNCEKIFIVDMGLEHQNEDVAYIKPKPLMVARGGRGGRGNHSEDPWECEPGEAGESLFLELELKLFADVGLVGFPHSGKSSLLTSLTRADIFRVSPFSTSTTPYIGNMKFDDGISVTLLDVPGLPLHPIDLHTLIGSSYLKHVERTKALLYVIDVRHNRMDPIAAFDRLSAEVYSHSPDLASLPFVVVMNKVDKTGDVRDQEASERISFFNRWINTQANPPLRVVSVSPKYGHGLPELGGAIHSLYLESRNIKRTYTEKDTSAMSRSNHPPGLG
eukprot:GHVN01065348.1.p1 GENE.GHVN01065348.1~~GHVN01065348.1.p1  ORF type:complete len:399 (-),score=62.65 GHVN01065348.1:9-1205(-)